MKKLGKEYEEFFEKEWEKFANYIGMEDGLSVGFDTDDTKSAKLYAEGLHLLFQAKKTDDTVVENVVRGRLRKIADLLREKIRKAPKRCTATLH